MFGLDQMAMMQKMKEAAEESKKKLDSIIVNGESGGGLVRIEMTANRKITSLQINTPIKDMEKEDLEDLLSVALDRAITAANTINEQEVSSTARQFLPGL